VFIETVLNRRGLFEDIENRRVRVGEGGSGGGEGEERVDRDSLVDSGSHKPEWQK
jgi:hypothetical protein